MTILDLIDRQVNLIAGLQQEAVGGGKVKQVEIVNATSALTTLVQLEAYLGQLASDAAAQQPPPPEPEPTPEPQPKRSLFGLLG